MAMEYLDISLDILVAVSVFTTGMVILYKLRKKSTNPNKYDPEYFQNFLDQAPTAIALIGANGAIERANRAFADLVDAKKVKDYVGHSIFDFLHDDDKPHAFAHFKEMREKGSAQSAMEIRLSGKNERNVMAYCATHGDGCVAHFIDITELKRLQTQFAQSQKMQAVGLLAGGIAHDFNNMLTAIIGFCDLLLMRHKAGDQSFADIMQIKQNSNRAANMVRQLLAFSRQQTLQPRVLSITENLTDLVHLLRRLVGERVELELIHGRDVGFIRVDPSQFEQVIINLAVNARDAMPQGGQLTIRTVNLTTRTAMNHGDDVMPPGDYIIVEIKDTGSGIDPEILPRVFEPFFSTKPTGAGTGLGLSTVYGIMRQTGGFVGVESELGKGTIFRLYLPSHRSPVEAENNTDDAQEAARDLSGMGTILLVEDEDAVRLFAARALRNKGYRVLEARGGEAALEIAESELDHIDLVLTDVVMPRVDGPALVEELRKKRRNLPVIFMSGYAEEDFRQRIHQGEESFFLTKPFTLKELAEKAKEALAPSKVV